MYTYFVTCVLLLDILVIVLLKSLLAYGTPHSVFDFTAFIIIYLYFFLSSLDMLQSVLAAKRTLHTLIK
jgi:hypothetical protein